MIDVEDSYGGASDLRAADKHDTDPLEVTPPTLATRIEESNDHVRQGISTAQIWSFVEIAPMATPAEVFRVCCTAVLLRKNMFNVKGNARSGGVGQVAILAPPAGPFAHQPA